MYVVLPRAGRVHGISKRRSRECAAAASGRVYRGSTPAAGPDLPDSAGSPEDAEERIVHVPANGQFELGQFRAVLLLAAHIRARFSR